MAVTRGAVTESYRGDPRRVVALLNRLRSTEIVTWLQYKHDAYVAVGLNMPGVKDEFEEHAEAELKHADLLAERIQQLGGDPVHDPKEIAELSAQLGIQVQEAATLSEMVAHNLAWEQKQVCVYRDAVRELGFDDPTSRRVLEKILAETEEHATELQNLLDERSPVTRKLPKAA